MIILGLNAYHGDSSACIVVDGKLIAEERFTRIKHRQVPDRQEAGQSSVLDPD